MAGSERLAPARLIHPDETWSPLDHTPPPEYIPPDWMGFHVGLRLTEGLRTLQHMPMSRGPQGFHVTWPAAPTTYEDLAGYMDDEAWKAERRAEVHFSWRKVIPSSIEIAHMEAAISWPLRYISWAPQLVRTVLVVAAVRARYRSQAHAARRMNLPCRIVRRWNQQGLDAIAAGLRRDRVPIF